MSNPQKGQHEELARTLGLYDVTMIGVAAMIGILTCISFFLFLKKALAGISSK